jgi:hypothetical protein
MSAVPETETGITGNADRGLLSNMDQKYSVA